MSINLDELITCEQYKTDKIDKKRNHIQTEIIRYFNNTDTRNNNCIINKISDIPQTELDELINDLKSKGYVCLIDELDTLFIS